MKCSKCGKSFKDIKAIGAHYRKSHPSAMKARKPKRANYSNTASLWMDLPEKKKLSLYHQLRGYFEGD